MYLSIIPVDNQQYDTTSQSRAQEDESHSDNTINL